MKNTPHTSIRLFPRSIKRRLPASYALIALLVALTLGGVLIGILSEYYHRQETDYLTRNANAIIVSLTHMIDSDASEDELQTQINLFAFLSRTHIELTDVKNVPDIVSESFVSVVDIDNEERPGVRLLIRELQGEQTWVGLPEPTAPNLTTKTEVIIQDGLVVETIEEDHPLADNVAVDFILQNQDVSNITHTFTTDNEIFVNSDMGLYGFGLGQTVDDISQITHSSQVIETTLVDADGIQQGILRLSEGPAYGVEIVTSVAWGWLLASLCSITLAIFVGYVMSRDVSQPLQDLTATTKQMASGDLSTRTHLQRADEFGTLARAFNDMANQIETTVSTLHHFVSDAAHEINTPITALRTNLELIQPDDISSHEHITHRRALEQVKRLEDLTRNLLHLSRLESSISDEQQVELDMITMVKETVGFFASRADQANIELELSCPAYPIPYTITAQHLQTALSNVIDNALKFTPAEGQVSVALECADNKIRLHIRDTGVGIPSDHLQYVFNRFHRASNVSDYAGSGLGLSIVHAIIERYGGYITINNLECGTQVSMFLPMTS